MKWSLVSVASSRHHIIEGEIKSIDRQTDISSFLTVCQKFEKVRNSQLSFQDLISCKV